ncbi:MAG TPA: plastocyanin/azurin family copper-binding protein [Vicinamibacterales bacterium]|jgi:plastocyanin|nr:plastocyanin/azurin family copper-binding protein [Vicinamibacterales bacterium]
MRIAAKLIAIAALTGMFAACGGSSNSNTNPTSPSSASGISIVSSASTMTTTAFNPNPMVVAKGTTVTWTNNDTTTHTSTADNGMWSSGGIAPGGTFSTTLQTAGTFTYHCTIHPGMVGTMTVQ